MGDGSTDRLPTPQKLRRAWKHISSTTQRIELPPPASNKKLRGIVAGLQIRVPSETMTSPSTCTG